MELHPKFEDKNWLENFFLPKWSFIKSIPCGGLVHDDDRHGVRLDGLPVLRVVLAAGGGQVRVLRQRLAARTHRTRIDWINQFQPVLPLPDGTYTYFQTKNNNFGTFWRPLEYKRLIYSTAIWDIHITVICYISKPFGDFGSGTLV
jgi:hypothetical protein